MIIKDFVGAQLYEGDKVIVVFKDNHNMETGVVTNLHVKSFDEGDVEILLDFGDYVIYFMKFLVKIETLVCEETGQVYITAYENMRKIFLLSVLKYDFNNNIIYFKKNDFKLIKGYIFEN